MRILAVLRGRLHRRYGVLVVLILLLDLVRVALLVLALIVLVHVALIVVVRVRAVCYLGRGSLGVFRFGRSGFGWFGRFISWLTGSDRPLNPDFRLGRGAAFLVA